MPVPELVDGHLPMGRWVCTPDEVEAAFVAPDTGVRAAIWADWLTLKEALTNALGEVAACWMAGSFFSDKAVPGDIDCLWVVDTQVWATALNSGDPALAGFLLNCAGGGQVKAVYQLNVDSYVLEWMPTPGPTPPVGAQIYHLKRGYWDDLWIRVRNSDQRLDAIPRRGYLEVILDGYR